VTFAKWVLSVLAGAACVSVPTLWITACWVVGDNWRWGMTGTVMFFAAIALTVVAYMAWALD